MNTRHMKTTSMAARIAGAAIGLCLACTASAAIREEPVSYRDGDAVLKGFVVKHAYSTPRATELGKQFNLPFSYRVEATSQAGAEASKFFGEVFK